MSIEIIFNSEHCKAPAFLHYLGQPKPQPAYLTSWLLNNTLSLRVYVEKGVVGRSYDPLDHVSDMLYLPIDPATSRKSLAALAQDETLAALLYTIKQVYQAGEDCESTLPEPDSGLVEQIKQHLQTKLSTVTIYHAQEWIEETGCIPTLLIAGSIVKYADTYRCSAEKYGYALIGDCDELVASWASNMLEKLMSKTEGTRKEDRQIAAMLVAYDAERFKKFEVLR